MNFDLIVIGGGPAGLMTSMTAANQGLDVLLVEIKKDIASHVRMCLSMLYMKPGFHGETMRIEEDKIVFINNDFSVKYSGGYRPIKEWNYVSPGGHRFRAGKKESPSVILINKEALLQGLVDEAKKAGVTFWNESIGLKVENTQDGAKALTNKGTDEPDWVQAKRCVISDGLYSRVTVESFPEVWNARKLLVSGSGISYFLEGVDCPHEEILLMFKTMAGNAYLTQNAHTGSDGRPIWEAMGVYSGQRPDICEKAHGALDYLMNTGPNAKWFKNAKVVKRRGVAADIYSEIQEPRIKNALLVGDVAAMQEVDNQGALCCGYQAGRAAAEDIKGNNGFERYAAWWKKSFEFNRGPEALAGLAKGWGLFSLGPEALDYFFSLAEKNVADAFLDHHEFGDVLEREYLRYKPQMDREKPAISQKIAGYFGIGASESKAKETLSMDT